LEAERISNRLRAVLLPVVTSAHHDLAATSVATQQQLLRQHANLFVQVNAYCGAYAAAAGSKHRYDVAGAMEQVEELLAASGVGATTSSSSSSSSSSAMMYRVEPPATAFAVAVDDLQVSYTIPPFVYLC
jgi:hypothetical protein